MLLDLAVLPEVFEAGAYSDPGLCGHFLNVLKPVLFEDAVVRDLRNGGWSQWMRNSAGKCHHATAEIVQTLASQGRLALFPSELGTEPEDSSEWCHEALATHQKSPLNAIICGNKVAADFMNDPLVQPLEKMHECDWYKDRACSVRLNRRTPDYLTTLRVPLKWCKSAMFIDPHLDPSRNGYAEFSRILGLLRTRDVPAQIELHRGSYSGGGENRQMLSLADVEKMFAPLSTMLTGAKLTAKVFVWDSMHDRYLITNQIGIAVANGFDISTDANEKTTWTRLSRKDREDVQREFDVPSGRHQLKFSFDIGFA